LARLETDHFVPLPGTSWQVWRHALIRSTGFPADGLDRLRDLDIAASADELLAGRLSEPEFAARFARARQQQSEQVRAIAADPLFREAITWQNPAVLVALESLTSRAPGGQANRRQRQRERVVARYWQRYCGKTETIGFFGPVCWVTIDPAAAAVVARPGQSLLRDRQVYLEHWALARYADQLAADLDVRCWLRPALQPHLALSGRQVLSPARPPVALTRAELAVLRHLDGRRPAREVAAVAVSDAESGLRKVSDVYLLLDGLVERGLVRWDFNLPVTRQCAELLADRIAAIGDETARNRAAAGLDRLAAARAKVAAAAGDPASLRLAIADLEAEFTALTADRAQRRPGQAYAARRVYWEEASRDLDVTIGEPVLAAIAAPLAIVLQAARWLSAELAARYQGALRELYAELAAEEGSAAVPLGQLWFLTQGLFYGSSGRLADRVAAEFGRRWSKLFGLDQAQAQARRVGVRSHELGPAAAQAFPAARPGWPDARLHSPDLQICAASGEAIGRGDFTVVLGELHVAWATNGCAGAVSFFPDPAELSAALAADVGTGRMHPLLPADWPRNTPRLAFALDDADDLMLGIAPAPGADPGRLVPISALSVTDADGVLVASVQAPLRAGGASPALAGLGDRRWPLTTVFARPLSEVAVEAFKLAGTGPHTPRITIDALVVARETWRLKVRDCGLVDEASEAGAFLAARRLRQSLGLPERVFVKIGTEVKPVFVDFAGPFYVQSLRHMLRAARAAGGDDTEVSITEMLPAPDQAWLPDAAGRTYLSELRLHVRDPVPADPPALTDPPAPADPALAEPARVSA